MSFRQAKDVHLPLTVTLKDVKDVERERIWSARPWQRQQPSKVILWMYVNLMQKGVVFMDPLIRHKGKVAALDRVNVDTDQIVPKQFLKRVERSGFGQFLFYDWRYLDDGSPNPDFELN